MPECEHPNTPNCPGGECVCYMEERTPEQEEQFQTIIVQKMKPPEGKEQDCDFGAYVFIEDEDFEEAIFSGDANFHGATFCVDPVFLGATFSGGAVFNMAAFSEGASFDIATFNGLALFEGAIFSGYADFSGATFNGVARFRSATFSGYADFTGATFSEDADLRNATFVWDACFSRVAFERGAVLDHCGFRGLAEFIDATSPGNRPVSIRGVEVVWGKAASLYRLAKQSYQDSGEYGLAGNYHYLERTHSLSERSRWPNWPAKMLAGLWAQILAWLHGRRFSLWDRPRAWRLFIRRQLGHCLKGDAVLPKLQSIKRGLGNCVEFVIGRWVFGYGEKLWRPLITAAVVILVCACIFPLTGIRRTQHVELANAWDYLYFSVVTFSTLGYGDMTPTSVASCVVANIESLTGLVLVAAFAVCLAKRYARG